MKNFNLLLTLLICTRIFSQPFTPGNVVVVRIGDGNNPLSNAAQPVFLDEYAALTGQLIQSKALPTTISGSNRRLTMSGTATSEGALTLSADKRFLCLAGYDTTVGAASIASAPAVGKTVAIVNSAGIINTSTGITAGNGYNGNNVRGAVTNDGTGVWMSGAGSGGSGGTYYVPANNFTSAPVKISTTPTNTRTVNIHGGQLYVSAASGTFYGVSQVGSGLPTTGGQITSLLPGVNDSSVYAFVVFDASTTEPGNDLLYLADDRTDKGGIIKYSKVNGTWTNNGKIASSRSMRGLALLNACGKIRGYVSSQDTIYTFIDNAGYNQPLNASLTPLVSVPLNSVFRGIAFAPNTQDPIPPVATLSNSSPVKCFGASNGSATISVTGGTGSLSYVWNDNGTGASRNNLSVGTYSVTVTDQLGCTSVVNNISITQPPALNVSTNATPVSCFGQSNGSITVNVSGGTPNYSFNWSGGSNTNLSAGVYSVTVTDANGCTVVKTDTVKQPSQLVVNATKGNVTCASTNNGFINLNPTGGNGGYTFLWNDNNTQQNRNNLTAGIYAVTITDSKGCTATRQDTILQTASLNVSGNVSSVTCFGANNGSIVVSATGGSGNYTFNWSNGATGVNLSNLSPGTYTVTVDDGNNCTGTGSFTIIQPDSIGISATVVNPNCFGGTGSVKLTLSGGTGNLNAVWSNNANPSALAAGTYTVTVSDENGCTNTRTFTLTQPDSLKISGTVTNASANGANDGSIILTVSGGTPNYDYEWSNIATTKDLINISAGTYIVTVTDDKGCTKTATFVVSQPSAIEEAGEKSPVIALNISGKKIQLMLEESLKFEENIITVYNMQGQKFYSIETKNLLTTNISIDLSYVPAGLYFLALNGKNSQHTVKFILK